MTDPDDIEEMIEFSHRLVAVLFALIATVAILFAALVVVVFSRP